MSRWWDGFNLPPRYVGWLRGLVAVVTLAILEAINKYLADNAAGAHWMLVAPLVFFLIRWGESEVDQWRKPKQNVGGPA